MSSPSPIPTSRASSTSCAMQAGFAITSSEEDCWMWSRQFILFHDKRHPCDLGATEFSAFLAPLALEREVAASTQAQALNALVFFFRSVLERAREEFVGVLRAKRTRKLPVVVFRGETMRLLPKLGEVAR